MKAKEIDICIPFYNTNLEYFKNCLNSIINQTNKNFNLILLNDGSTNKELEEYLNNEILNKELGFEVFYYKQINIGLFNSRLELLKYTKSNYIFYMDSDDILFENSINIMIKNIYHNIFNYNEPEIISFDYITAKYENENIISIGREKYKNIFVGFIEGNDKIFKKYLETIRGYDVTIWSKIYKRDLLLRVYNEKYNFLNNIKIKIKSCEDIMHSFMIFSCANTYLSIDKTLIKYTINANRHIINKSISEQFDYYNIVKKLKQIDYDYSNDIIELIKYRLGLFDLISKARIKNLLKNEKTCDEIIEYFNSELYKYLPKKWKIVDKKLITDNENIL